VLHLGVVAAAALAHVRLADCVPYLLGLDQDAVHVEDNRTDHRPRRYRRPSDARTREPGAALAAEEEINVVLPDTLEDFEEAVARGELKEVKARLDDVIGDV
jgi:hypothetical protein